MRQLTSIVAVNGSGVIGCRNSLPWRIKSDMAFFRKTTSGNCVVMGRKTHDSLQQCLPHRYNVVLSKQLHLFVDKPECVLSYGVDEALVEAEAAPVKYSEIFIIGGSTMYHQFDPFVDRYLITLVDKQAAEADSFFDVEILNNSTDWNIALLNDWQQNDGDEAPFKIFELKARDSETRIAKRRAAIESVLMKRRQHSKTANRASKKKDVPTPLAFGW